MLIPKSAFPVSRIAGKEESRYAMQAVHLSRAGGKARATATDGRRALRVEWDEEKQDADNPATFPPVFEKNPTHERAENFAALIPSESWDKLGKSIPRSKNRHICRAAVDEVNSNGTIHMATTDLATVNRVDATAPEYGSFPPVDDCMTDYEILPQPEKQEARNTAVAIHVNARMLAELLSAIVATGAGNCGCPEVKLTIPLAGNRPIRLDARGAEGEIITAIHMPVNPSF